MVSACGGIYRKFCKYFTTLATVNLSTFGVCSTCIWDLQGHINSLERVQKFELKVCTNTWSFEYESLLQLCNLPTLSSRRHYMKLYLLYQVLNGHLNFSNAPIVPQNLFRNASISINHISSVQLPSIEQLLIMEQLTPSACI